MLLKQVLSAHRLLRPALARRSNRGRAGAAGRVRTITHREEGRKLPREMVAAMTADGDATSFHESMRSRMEASSAAPPPADDPASTSDLSEKEYVALADEALDSILAAADELGEASSREDVECELASGVLTFTSSDGTWVVNKQVPNRQLWLSSPLSGPCRYEFVAGAWTHTRDGSALADLLGREIGLVLEEE